MVLVDTSIWVAHFRFKDLQLQALLNDAQVLIHDFIVGELACGNLRARNEILSLLRTLPCAPLVDQTELLYFIEKNRLMGKGIGFVDAYLLASAQLMGAPLWTSDKRLKRAAARMKLCYNR